MAIPNESSEYISQKPDETITEDIKKTETVVTPSTTTTQPLFSKNERVAYTLLPLASALLQGKRTGSGSMLGDTLASLGQGLMGTTDVALKIKQLEGANQTKKSTTRKQYKVQPGKKVQIGNQVFTPEMGKILSLDEATVAQYPVDTFIEVTKDSKVTSKSIFVEKPAFQFIDQAKKCAQLLKKNKKIFFGTNYILRASPRFKKLKKMIKKKFLGDIYHFEGDYNYGRLKKLTNYKTTGDFVPFSGKGHVLGSK